MWKALITYMILNSEVENKGVELYYTSKNRKFSKINNNLQNDTIE